MRAAAVEQRFGEEGGGGFAVGAGDAGGGELALGMAEECGGGLGERAAAVFDFENGHAGLIDEQMIEGGRGVSDDAERAGGEGLVDVAIAVGRAALHGDEDGAGPHAAGVVFDAGDGLGGVAGSTPTAVISAMSSFQFMLVLDCRLEWAVLE